MGAGGGGAGQMHPHFQAKQTSRGARGAGRGFAALLPTPGELGWERLPFLSHHRGPQSWDQPSCGPGHVLASPSPGLGSGPAHTCPFLKWWLRRLTWSTAQGLKSGRPPQKMLGCHVFVFGGQWCPGPACACICACICMCVRA